MKFNRFHHNAVATGYVSKISNSALSLMGRRDPMDLVDPIHSLEIEAYRSVLKAFFAQSDLLSWGKVDIISHLRKELNVTDTEHTAILLAVRSDESVKCIRDNASGSAQNSSIIRKTSSPVAYLPPENMSHCQYSLASFPFRSSMPLKFKDNGMAAEVATFSNGSVDQSTRMIKQKFSGLEKTTHQLEKGFCKYDFSDIKNRPKVSEMHATNRIVHNVKKVQFDMGNIDPVVVDKARPTARFWISPAHQGARKGYT